MVQKGEGFGVASLVCGLMALMFFLMLINIPLVIAAEVFGILQIIYRRKKILAIAGMSAALLSVVFMLVGWAAILYGTSRADPQFMEHFQQYQNNGTY